MKMLNGKSWLVWVVILLMVALAAFAAVVFEGLRRDAQRDRPGGPIPFVEPIDDGTSGTLP